MSETITPTVGRVVHFYEQQDVGPMVALIAFVHSNTCVNLGIFDCNGVPKLDPPTSVTLVQPGEDPPELGNYCQWMPYQLEQAGIVPGKPEPPSSSTVPAEPDRESRTRDDTAAAEPANASTADTV